MAECFRVLRPGGRLLAGVDIGVGFAFDEETGRLRHRLPFNPLKDAALYAESLQNGWGVQFSHTIDEQIAGQLRVGFVLKDVYQDTDGSGVMHDYNLPGYCATLAIRP